MVTTWTGLFTDHCSAHCPARFTTCLPPPLSPDKAYNRCSELPGRQLRHCQARSGLAQLHGCSCAWWDGFSIPWPPPPGSSSSPLAATTKVSPDFSRWLRGWRRHHPQGKATTLDRALDSQSHFGWQTQGPAAALGTHHLPRPACSLGTSLRPSTPPALQDCTSVDPGAPARGLAGWTEMLLDTEPWWRAAAQRNVVPPHGGILLSP